MLVPQALLAKQAHLGMRDGPRKVVKKATRVLLAKMESQEPQDQMPKKVNLERTVLPVPLERLDPLDIPELPQRRVLLDRPVEKVFLARTVNIAVVLRDLKLPRPKLRLRLKPRFQRFKINTNRNQYSIRLINEFLISNFN